MARKLTKFIPCTRGKLAYSTNAGRRRHCIFCTTWRKDWLHRSRNCFGPHLKLRPPRATVLVLSAPTTFATTTDESAAYSWGQAILPGEAAGRGGYSSASARQAPSRRERLPFTVPRNLNSRCIHPVQNRTRTPVGSPTIGSPLIPVATQAAPTARQVRKLRSRRLCSMAARSCRPARYRRSSIAAINASESTGT